MGPCEISENDLFERLTKMWDDGTVNENFPLWLVFSSIKISSSSPDYKIAEILSNPIFQLVKNIF